MSTLGSNVATLADWAKRLDPDGKVAAIVELLAQKNEVLDDMMWKEGNLPTGDRTTVRTGLPTVAWRLLNQGVQPSKSTTAQIDESCGILEAWSEVDEDLAKLNGNTASFRLSEAQAFIEAMNQEMTQTLFYGNSGLAPEEFTGLSIRYSSTTAANGQNIVAGGAAGGQTDCTSIWLLVWGSQSIYGIFPKGSKAGLEHNDLGLQTIETSSGIGGTRMRAYQDQFKWKCGISLRDWRYVSRYCNIDISANNEDLINGMIKQIHRVPNLTTGKAAFYMNRTMSQRLDLLRRDDVITGGGLTYDVVDGRRIMSFRGIPIRTVDALLETESTVS
jgi:hypothetical protein